METDRAREALSKLVEVTTAMGPALTACYRLGALSKLIDQKVGSDEMVTGQLEGEAEAIRCGCALAFIIGTMFDPQLTEEQRLNAVKILGEFEACAIQAFRDGAYDIKPKAVQS